MMKEDFADISELCKEQQIGLFFLSNEHVDSDSHLKTKAHCKYSVV